MGKTGRRTLPLKKEAVLLEALRKVAPGTELREAVEHIIAAKTGGLIVIGDTNRVSPICNGGFALNCPLSSQRLYELAKMDGAIVLNQDVTQILRANVHLVPDSSMPTKETGMRHRTAERLARQTKALVISISQKRDIVSLFLSDIKYVLEDIRVIIAKANQALQTLERYKNKHDQVAANLSALEFEDLVAISDVVSAIQRSEMVLRIANEVDRYIVELGVEGRLLRMQLVELVGNIAEDSLMLLNDYAADNTRVPKIKVKLAALSSDALLDSTEVCNLLGFDGDNILEEVVHARGYRMLKKIPRLPAPVVEKIVNRFSDFQNILKASIDSLDEVEGVGRVRAQTIQDGLKRLREYSVLERYI